MGFFDVVFLQPFGCVVLWFIFLPAGPAVRYGRQIHNSELSGTALI